ncbi:hypothetical protein [Synechococcus phage S-N03]|uniref:Uncharacterized protein n=1 Tax=Synechococcus phage S-N03 TaxID=2718943 RepID=A0A6G8R5M1_9CAUD|nr:hypothetical protein PQC09_gp038 [Synechococcus phage S-N03]QIN96673.1 hypothetical protein [Synechococcus phage S-N03]
MAKQLVHISLRGCNEFTEVINAPTRGAAVATAKARYPEHRKIWCVGGATEPTTTAPCSDYAPQSVDQGPVGGFLSSAASSVSETVSEADGGAAFLLLFVGAGAAIAAVGVAVLTFPVWLGGLTAKASTKLYSRFNPSPKLALSLLLATTTFAGGAAGGFALQKEYMPEVAQAQVEMVQTLLNQGN